MKTPASVKLHLVQMEVLPGRPVENTARILQRVNSARAAGAELVVFPEMAIPGYLIGDEWERPAFLRECEACGREVCAASAGVTVAFGNVGIDWQKRNEDGRVRKYNALFVAENGRLIGPDNRSGYDFAIKTLLPNYRQFDDSRHFYDLRKLAAELGRPVNDLLAPVRTSRLALGCVLCEDAWDLDYALSPLGMMAQHGVDLFLNASCSPYTVNKNHKRNRVFSAVAERLRRPLAYVNNVGIQNNGKTVFTFDGASCVYDGHGHQIAARQAFEETVLTCDVPLGGEPFGTPIDLRDDGIADLYAAVRYGTARFLALCGARRVPIGISGGIDSSLVAALYSRILPPEDVLLVNMPGAHTSPTTRALARDLARNLGTYYAEVPIMDSVRVTTGQLDGIAIASLDGRMSRKLELGGLLVENVQARDRSARVLAAISAAFGSVFTCNANKSEVTVGYTTLYGDLAGYLANIADLWKGEVYAMARHINEQVFGRQAIPQGCFDIVPSAELSPAQNVDEGKGDPLIYPYHDCLFRSWVESWNRTTPEEILMWYAEGVLEAKIGYAGRVAALFPDARAFVTDLERWWNAYQGLGVAKRIQAPPVLAVKRRAFGFDHREAQMGARYTRQYEGLKARLLG